MTDPGFSELIFAGLGVMLVVEGLLPFFGPRLWRATFERVLQLSDGQIRFLGLASLVAGGAVLLLLWG